MLDNLIVTKSEDVQREKNTNELDGKQFIHAHEHSISNEPIPNAKARMMYNCSNNIN